MEVSNNEWKEWGVCCYLWMIIRPFIISSIYVLIFPNLLLSTYITTLDIILARRYNCQSAKTKWWCWSNLHLYVWDWNQEWMRENKIVHDLSGMCFATKNIIYSKSIVIYHRSVVLAKRVNGLILCLLMFSVIGISLIFSRYSYTSRFTDTHLRHVRC